MSKPDLTDFTPNTLKVPGSEFYPVIYFGRVVYVPEDFKWIALDPDGDLCAYKEKPTRMSSFWSRKSTDTVHPIKLANLSYNVGLLWIEVNWFNSRIKIKKLKKLSGASLHDVVGVES